MKQSLCRWTLPNMNFNEIENKQIESISSKEKIRIDDFLVYSPDQDLFYKSAEMDIATKKPVCICMRIGSKCNLNCNYCIGDIDIWKGSPSYEKTIKVLNALTVWSPLRIVWSGGEPSLYEYLPNLISASIKNGNYNVLTTNLTFNKKIRDQLDGFKGKVHFNFTIYGISRRTFINHTCMDLFDLFEENLNHLFNMDHLVSVTIIITNKWQEYLPLYLNWLKKYPLRKILLLKLSLTGRQNIEVSPASYEQLQKLEQYLKILDSKIPIVYPPPESSIRYKTGQIVVQASNDNAIHSIVNQKICETEQEFFNQIEPYIGANRKLYSTESYIL